MRVDVGAHSRGDWPVSVSITAQRCAYELPKLNINGRDRTFQEAREVGEFGGGVGATPDGRFQWMMAGV
jgi:hypothetical protein